MIIAGSRSLGVNVPLVTEAVLYSKFPVREVVTGWANGIDAAAGWWAIRYGYPIKGFPVTEADYKRIGKAAPMSRNNDMAVYESKQPDSCLVAIWDGYSTGTQHMCDAADFFSVPKYLHRPDRGYLWQITNERYTAGFLTKLGTVVNAAPIIRQFTGLPIDSVYQYCTRMGYEFYPVDGTGFETL